MRKERVTEKKEQVKLAVEFLMVAYLGSSLPFTIMPESGRMNIYTVHTKWVGLQFKWSRNENNMYIIVI